MHGGAQSLGVFGSLEQKWGKGRVAYCKPLGQKYTDVVCNGKTLKVFSSPKRNDSLRQLTALGTGSNPANL